MTAAARHAGAGRHVPFLRPFVAPYAAVEQRFRDAYAAGSFTKGASSCGSSGRLPSTWASPKSSG